MTPRFSLFFLLLSLQVILISCQRENLPEPLTGNDGQRIFPAVVQRGPTNFIPSLSVAVRYYNPQPDCVVTSVDSIINMFTYVAPMNEGASRTQQFDLDADGTMDISFTSSTFYAWVSNIYPQNNHNYMFDMSSIGNHIQFLSAQVASSNIYNARLLTSGTLVDSSNTTWVSGTQLIREQYVQPTMFNQNFSGTKFVGFRLRNSSGQWQYGWLRVTHSNSVIGGMYYVHLEDWAFNQLAGTGITTGQTQ